MLSNLETYLAGLCPSRDTRGYRNLYLYNDDDIIRFTSLYYARTFHLLMKNNYIIVFT